MFLLAIFACGAIIRDPGVIDDVLISSAQNDDVTATYNVHRLMSSVEESASSNAGVHILFTCEITISL